LSYTNTSIALEWKSSIIVTIHDQIYMLFIYVYIFMKNFFIVIHKKTTTYLLNNMHGWILMTGGVVN